MGDRKEPLTLKARKKIKKLKDEIVEELLQRCGSNMSLFGAAVAGTNNNSSDDWQEFLEIRNLLKRLQLLEHEEGLSEPLKKQESTRQLNIDRFLEWFKQNGGDYNGVDIAEFTNMGSGLRATKQLCKSECFLTIPRKLMISTELPADSDIAELVEKDILLRSMSNVCLSLHLANEVLKDNSFWKPYFDILPTTFSTTLYSTPSEIELLKGSPVLDGAIKLQRNIARQYAYLYRLLNGEKQLNLGQLRTKFCYSLYRWAVTTVMTRQNEIPPLNANGTSALALIPLLDMCNHAEGQLSSDFDTVKDCCECFCARDVSPGEQVQIFYGPRTNAEFFLHNGFVVERNSHDKVNIKLGLSKNNNLFEKKLDLCKRFGIQPSGWFAVISGSQPFDSELIAFTRIFNMTADTISDNFHINMLRQAEGDCDLEGQNLELVIKSWSFLRDRLHLLLRVYPTSLEDDERLLQKPDLTEPSRSSVLLRLTEKRLLRSAADWIGLELGKAADGI